MDTKVWIGGLEKTYTYTGSAIKPELRVYDGTKKLTEKTDYTVSFKNNKAVGTATVTVKFKGNYAATQTPSTAEFEIVKAQLGMDIIAYDTGITDAKKVKKTVPPLTWAETGKSVSSKYFYFEYGDVTNAESVVTIKPKSNYEGTYGGQTTAKVKVITNNNLLISKAKVVFNPKSYAYTGEQITPSYKVTIGTTELTKNTDYRETLINAVNPGTATVVIEAKPGNAAGYVGSKTVTFKITGTRALKEEGTDSDFKYVLGGNETVPYAKGGAKPSVRVTDKGTELTEGKDYTLSYTKNKAVTNGAKTAEVKVKGKGNYKGNVTLKFAVIRQSLKASGIIIFAADQFATRQKLKAPKITVTDRDGKKLKAGTDYIVGTADDSDPENTDTKGVVSVKITGKDAYEEETVTVTYRYAEKTADISRAKAAKKIDDQIFTGNAVILSNAELTGILTAKDADGASLDLLPGKHFVVLSYSNNGKKGTGKVAVRGIGDFAGTKTLSFKILQKSVDYKGALIGGSWHNTQ